MEDPKRPVDYWNWSGQIWQKGIELNMRLWRDAMEGFWGTYRGESNRRAGEPSAQNPWMRAYEDYVHLSLRYAEDLVQLGLRTTRQMNRERPEETVRTSNDPYSAPSRAPEEPYQIRLSGAAGDTLTTSFSLHSSERVTKPGKMVAGDFIRESTGAKSRLKMDFQPESFSILPGDSQTVSLKINSPKNQPPGTYRCQVAVHGFEDARFDVLVDLTEPPKAPKPAPKAAPKAAPKKPARKSGGTAKRK